MFLFIQKDLQSINSRETKGRAVIIFGVKLFGIPVASPLLIMLPVTLSRLSKI